MRTAPALVLALLAWGVAAEVEADPCEAPLPRRGERFAGVVRYVGDGDSLCVGSKNRPETWVEVRLADFRAPELGEKGAGPRAKQHLVQLAFGRRVECVAVNRTYDRIAARCTLDGRPLGDQLRARGVREGGR